MYLRYICIFILLSLNCFVSESCDDYSYSFSYSEDNSFLKEAASDESKYSEEFDVPGQSGSMYSPGNLEDIEVQQYNWPEGRITYHIDVKSYDEVIEKRIESATEIIEKASCVKFVRDYDLREEPSSYVIFSNPDQERECVHSIKRGSDGETVVILGYDCLQERDILHSLMHLLGFKDEVTNPQRDSYVRVVWDNIQPKYRGLFTISNSALYKGEYDMLSIMHFHERAYSINGGATIVPLAHGQLIQPSDKLSLLDKMKLRMAFGHECNKRKVNNLIETCQNKPSRPVEDAESPSSGNGSEGYRYPSSDDDIRLTGNGTEINPSNGSATDGDKTPGGSGTEGDSPLSANVTAGDLPPNESGMEGDNPTRLSGTEGDPSPDGSGTDRDVTPNGSGTEAGKIPAGSGSEGESPTRLSGTEDDRSPHASSIHKDGTPIGSGIDGDRPLGESGSEGQRPPTGSASDGQRPPSGSGSDGERSVSGSGSDGERPLSGSGSEGQRPSTGSGSDGQRLPSGSGSDGERPLSGSGSDGQRPLSLDASDIEGPPFKIGALRIASGKSRNQILTNRIGIVKDKGLGKGSRTGKDDRKRIIQPKMKQSPGPKKTSRLFNKIKG